MSSWWAFLRVLTPTPTISTNFLLWSSLQPQSLCSTRMAKLWRGCKIRGYRRPTASMKHTCIAFRIKLKSRLRFSTFRKWNLLKSRIRKNTRGSSCTISISSFVKIDSKSTNSNQLWWAHQTRLPWVWTARGSASLKTTTICVWCPWCTETRSVSSECSTDNTTWFWEKVKDCWQEWRGREKSSVGQ